MKRSGSRYIGFVSVELVLSLCVLTVLAAALLPGVISQITHEKIDQTKGNMNILAQAIEMFYKDNSVFPEDLMDLVNTEQGSKTAYPNWKGSYLGHQSFTNGINTVKMDAWAKSYEIQTPTPEKMILVSPGPDRQKGTQDDITRVIDMTGWVYEERGRKTSEEIRIINTAITDYYEIYVDGKTSVLPLPGNWPDALKELQRVGLLQAYDPVIASPYYADEWGDMYRCDSPCRQVHSVNLR